MKEINIKLTQSDISELVGIIDSRIGQFFNQWQDAGDMQGEGFDYGYRNMQRLLSLLEKIFTVYQSIKSAGYTQGDNILFKQLGKIRQKVEFPPMIEKFYQDYDLEDAYSYMKSSVCQICGEKRANASFRNVLAHSNCPKLHGWYKCPSCGWLYPFEREYCTDPACKRRKLARCT